MIILLEKSWPSATLAAMKWTAREGIRPVNNRPLFYWNAKNTQQDHKSVVHEKQDGAQINHRIHNILLQEVKRPGGGCGPTIRISTPWFLWPGV